MLCVAVFGLQAFDKGFEYGAELVHRLQNGLQNDFGFVNGAARMGNGDDFRQAGGVALHLVDHLAQVQPGEPEERGTRENRTPRRTQDALR